jgi:hypothetical protein
MGAGQVSDARIYIESLVDMIMGHLPPPSKTFSRGFPENFEPASHFKTFQYKGHITDMDLSSPTLPGVYPSISEITFAANYWYSDSRMAWKLGELLPAFRVQPILPNHFERGSLCRCGSDTRLWAFLQKMRELIAINDLEMLAQFKEAALNVQYVVIHFSGSVIDTFWSEWQLGEDALQAFEEAGNDLTFRRVEKLEYLQALLLTQGKPGTAKDLAEQFQNVHKRVVS